MRIFGLQGKTLCAPFSSSIRWTCTLRRPGAWALGLRRHPAITQSDARQALQRLAYRPDLVVMNLRNAEGGTLDLLDIIAAARIATSVVLVAEATEIATVRHRISLDGIEVLPTEIQSFSHSGRRLCGLELPDV